MSTVEQQIMELKDTLKICSAKIDALIVEVATVKASYDMTKLIIQWIAFPLVVLLGGLIGIKIAFPNAL